MCDNNVYDDRHMFEVMWYGIWPTDAFSCIVEMKRIQVKIYASDESE